jgi:hypothetical protein
MTGVSPKRFIPFQLLTKMLMSQHLVLFLAARYVMIDMSVQSAMCND